MLAYTGIETVSNMAEEAEDPGHDVPKAGQPRADRGARRVRRHLGHRAVGPAGGPWQVSRATSGPAATETGHDGYENDPVLGIISHLGLHGTVLTLAQYYVGMLAATILFIATNAGADRDLAAVVVAGRAPPAAERLLALHPRYRTPWFTIVFFSVARGAADPARQDQRARQPVLVRRDAVVHDRARGGDRVCASRIPTASVPTGCRGTCASAAPRSR